MDTLTEAIAELEERGWTSQFEVKFGSIHCVGCGEVADPEAVGIDEIVRFEGPTDPADESILFAITSPCGHKGTLVGAFGSETPSEDAEAFRVLGNSPEGEASR